MQLFCELRVAIPELRGFINALLGSRGHLGAETKYDPPPISRPCGEDKKIFFKNRKVARVTQLGNRRARAHRTVLIRGASLLSVSRSVSTEVWVPQQMRCNIFSSVSLGATYLFAGNMLIIEKSYSKSVRSLYRGLSWSMELWR